MMQYINKSRSVIIILHEIYGINQHIRRVSENYSSRGFDVICPDLLNLNQNFSYEEEQQAYDYFKDNIGFISAAKQVKNLVAQISDKYEHIFILGYSIGATIGWLCCEEDKCSGIIGYYGSRIRDYLNITPKCQVLLMFASDEKATNAGELVSKLEKKANVQAHILSGKHGFADFFSKNYLSESCDITESLAAEFLESRLIK